MRSSFKLKLCMLGVFALISTLFAAPTFAADKQYYQYGVALCLKDISGGAGTLYATCVTPMDANGNPLPSGTSANPLYVLTPATSNPPTITQFTTTTSPVALPAQSYPNGFIITASVTNTGLIYVGGTGQTGGTTTTNSYILSPGQSWPCGCNNANLATVLGSDATQIGQVTGN